MVMDHTLTSGTKVTLRPITLLERQKARDVISVIGGLATPNEVRIENSFEAIIMWCRFGLAGIDGVEFETYKDGAAREYPTDDVLNMLSDIDMTEISNLVSEQAALGTQKKKE